MNQQQCMCGYKGDDFGKIDNQVLGNGSLTQRIIGPDDNLNGNPATLIACPKCGTVKLLLGGGEA